MTARDDELGALRWNWEGAYDITAAGDGERWTARRRDGRGAEIEAPTADELGCLIRQDYTAAPVPRDLP
jgi:hypothetical protein